MQWLHTSTFSKVEKGTGNVSVYSNEISAGQLQVLEVRVVEAKKVPLEYS